ncbi:MFS transporter [Rhabdothermincola sp.]|uniref:MFS transporter n=1 Tax=Rhabdothermincola sp. TaxID=2820405 RepID=UPI002FE142D4
MKLLGPSARRRERPALALVFAITVTGILANTLVNAPLPDILDDFGVPDTGAGPLVAAATLPGIAIAPAIGLLADRFGRRQVLMPCLVVFGLGGVGAAFAPSFGALLGLRLVQGVGSAGLINLAVVLLGDYWEGTERARLIGYNAAVLTVSVAIFPAVGGLLAAAGGWRWSFVPYGFALVTALAVWRGLPPRPTPVPIPMRRQVHDALAVLRQPAVLGAVSFGFVLFVLIFGLFLTVLPLLLEQRFGLAAGQRGFVLAVPATGATVAALALGRLRARFGRRTLILVASMLFTAGFAVIGAAPTLGLVFAGAVLYGLGEGMSIPTVQDVVAGYAPEASRGAVVAAWVGAARAGQTAGPLLAAVSMGAVGPGGTYLIGAVVALGMVVAVLLVRVGRIEDRYEGRQAVTSGP